MSINKPLAWITNYGKDEYGIWAEFKFKGITQRLRGILPGSFWMGSRHESPYYPSEGPQHIVTLTQGFWMFDTAVTQALWEKVMGNNPSQFINPDRPVDSTEWYECQAFLEKINKYLGLKLSLPTEAQWEYACRAGTCTEFYFGDTISLEMVNYNGMDTYLGSFGGWREETVVVKSFPPNAWGLYEMHGNVGEWCSDGERNYSAKAQTNPVGPLDDVPRMIRGGSWIDPSHRVKSACRCRGTPCYDRHPTTGFRCVQALYV